MTELVSIDARSFKKFASALRKAAPALAVEMRAGLKEAGNLVANDARSRASFSAKIPGSIKVSTAGGKVTVKAGGSAAPEAAPLENKGKAGTFRHPVYGQMNVWVSQPAHPFLHPALAAKGEEAKAAVAETIEHVLRDLGGEF